MKQHTALMYNSASLGHPAVHASSVNRTEEDRVLPGYEEKKMVAYVRECVFLHVRMQKCPEGECGRHDANLQGFLPT